MKTFVGAKGRIAWLAELLVHKCFAAFDSSAAKLSGGGRCKIKGVHVSRVFFFSGTHDRT